MVHIKQVETAVQVEPLRAEASCKLHGALALLGNHGADNGRDCENDQEYNGQFDRPEKAPKDIWFSVCFG